MLIPQAFAATGASPSATDMVSQFAPLVVIFVLFYFLMIRPQQKKMKETRAMLEALQKGDEVVTSAGVLGRVVKVAEHYLTIEISEGVEVVVQRAAVGAKLEKGTIKAQR